MLVLGCALTGSWSCTDSGASPPETCSTPGDEDDDGLADCDDDDCADDPACQPPAPDAVTTVYEYDAARMPDGREGLRLQIASPEDPWRYRCYQPDRLDARDTARPVPSDWRQIEFDVVFPAPDQPRDGAIWLFVTDAGGANIARDQDAAPSTATDPSDPYFDTVIVPWPGTRRAANCTADCPLKVAGNQNQLSKLSEGGFWRVVHRNEWYRADPPEAYEGFEPPMNPLVMALVDAHPEWGVVKISGCARDNLAAGGRYGDEPGDYVDHWGSGFDAVKAALGHVTALAEPAGFVAYGKSSGGTSALVLSTRIAGEDGDTALASAIKGIVVDSGGADLPEFRRHKDEAADAGGWEALPDGVFAACQPEGWRMGDVFDGAMPGVRTVVGEELLADTQGACVDPSDQACIRIPVLFGTTRRDYTILCSSDAMYDDVYGGAEARVAELRLAGSSLGHGFYRNDVFDDPVPHTCASNALPAPTCTAPGAANVIGDKHSLDDDTFFQTLVDEWFGCVLVAESDSERNACAFNCVLEGAAGPRCSRGAEP